MTSMTSLAPRSSLSFSSVGFTFDETKKPKTIMECFKIKLFKIPFEFTFFECVYVRVCVRHNSRKTDAYY